MTKAQAKNILKEGLKEAHKDGYKANSVDEALDNLSTKFADLFEQYFDERVAEINQQAGNTDTGLRNLFGQLIDELKNQQIHIGTNLNQTTLTNIKEQL